VHSLVRARLDAAVAAPRLVTIEPSLAHLMLLTPGCTPADREIATAALARTADEDDEEEPPPAPKKRRWWQRHG
jgi:hypothetical protein